jgi:hypothetical protein
VGDVEMTARPITNTGERLKVLSRIASPNKLDARIEGSPLIELTQVSRVTLPGASGTGFVGARIAPCEFDSRHPLHFITPGQTCL